MACFWNWEYAWVGPLIEYWGCKNRLGAANGGCGSDHGSIASDGRVRFTSTVGCDAPVIERTTSRPHPPFAAHGNYWWE
ncbi:hypothetical protein QJS10_CPA08g00735 [Acorus calamus]|uniref:Uncharacterized protein n=1 Tax=Acorus calamus TaxID=4465 RepID=A0AAV9ED01_ACOCL|nr:hypothetical protein QJS10_CPA08g00735 [Acorus calamus]